MLKIISSSINFISKRIFLCYFIFIVNIINYRFLIFIKLDNIYIKRHNMKTCDEKIQKFFTSKNIYISNIMYIYGIIFVKDFYVFKNVFQKLSFNIW